MSDTEGKSLKNWMIRMTIFYLALLIVSGAVWYATTNATNTSQSEDIEMLKMTKADRDNISPIILRNQAEIEKLRNDKADKETVSAQLEGIKTQLNSIQRLLENK